MKCEYSSCSDRATTFFNEYDEDNDDHIEVAYCSAHHPRNRFKSWDAGLPVAGIIDPTDFGQVSNLIRVQNNIRDHKSL